jgi:DNA polymerase phi
VDASTRMFPIEPKKKKGKKISISHASPALEDTEQPIDVLVDTIIGFLEKSTAYMRTVSNQVFAMLSGETRESTIDLILTVSVYQAELKDSQIDERRS